MKSCDPGAPPCAPAVSPRSAFTFRPVVMGTNGMIASGHYLASRIGLHILEEGGNAVDAGVAAGFALAVLEPHNCGIGGEVPILLHLAKKKKVFCLSGQWPAPRGASVEWFRRKGIDAIPGEGLLAATVPDAVSTWIAALSRFGTMRLSRVLEPAIDLAARGFPMYEGLRSALSRCLSRFMEEWPSSGRAYLPGGRVPAAGDIYVQAELAGTLRLLADAESRERKRGRRQAMEAARDVFYKGEIARKMADFARSSRIPDSTGKRNRGFLSMEDMLSYASRIEDPVNATYRGHRVYKCGPWSQGPVFLQQLKILEGYDLASMGRNSAEYIHMLIETAKLAFADRDRYYGDPDFARVPMDALLSGDYAARRRNLIDPGRASMEMRPGDTCPFVLPESRRGRDGNGGDTTHLDVADRWGNVMAATPSGGWFQSSPAVEGLGFPLGTRMQMFSLDPAHPNALMPGKRPRTTLSPSLAIRDGAMTLAFGTAGGDRQDQWTLQFFLNCVEFGMNIQSAADAPVFHTVHFPESFHPHAARPGTMHVESRIPPSTITALRKRGHKVKVDGDWSHGRVMGILRDAASGVLHGAATVRLETGCAIGW